MTIHRHFPEGSAYIDNDGPKEVESEAMVGDRFPPTAPRFDIPVSYLPGAVFGQQLRTNVMGIELRGLLKLVVESIFVHRDGRELDVVITIKVPDRDNTAKFASISFRRTILNAPTHRDEHGRLPEQAAAVEALEWLWSHELHEGLLVNGVHVWDPEAEH